MRSLGRFLVDRCICEQRTFAELLPLARADGLTVEDLAARFGVGTHCGLCIAYWRRGIATGETEFGELLAKEPLHERSSGGERKLQGDGHGASDDRQD